MGCAISDEVDAIDLSRMLSQQEAEAVKLNMGMNIPKQMEQPNVEGSAAVENFAGQLKLTTEKMNKQPIDSWISAINRIKQLFIENPKLSPIFDYQALNMFFNEFDRYYTKDDDKSKFFKCVLELTDELLSQKHGNSPQYYRRIGKKMHKWENAVHFNCKNTLNILKYIAVSKSGLNDKQNPYYNHFFQKLDFSFSLQQAEKLTQITRFLCNYNLNAFAFIAIYLQQSIRNIKEEEGNTVQILKEKCKKIQTQLSHILKELQKKYPASTAETGKVRKIQGIDSIDLSQKRTVIKTVKGSSKNVQILKKFIVDRAKDAKKDYQQFVNLVKPICINKGYGFKSGLKVNNEKQTSAIVRVMEKLFDDDIKKLEPYSFDEYFSQKLTEITEKKPSVGQIIKQFVKVEQKVAQQKIRQIVESKEELQFTVSDMVRAKCMFGKLEDVILAIQSLLVSIPKSGYKIKGVKNRLGKHTKDFMFKIQLTNSVAELQLALSFDSIGNQFNHKIYELLRSSLYSPVTNLFIHKEKWGNKFFQEIYPIAQKMNNHNNKKDLFEQDISYPQVIGDIDCFITKFELKIKKEQTKNPLDNLDFKKIVGKLESYEETISGLVVQSAQTIKSIKPCFKASCLYHGYKKIQKAQQLIKKHKQECKQLFNCKDEKSLNINDKFHLYKVYEHQGLICRSLDQFQGCIQHFQKALSILKSQKGKDVLNTYQNLSFTAQAYIKLSNYQKAVECYNQCSKLLESDNKMDTSQYAMNLENLANVQTDLYQLDEALSNLTKSMNLKASIYGKQSVEYSESLNNVGMAYFKKSLFDQALEYFKHSLSLVEKNQGKQSLLYSYRLNNMAMVLNRQQKYQQAKQLYEVTLSIKLKITGPDSMDTSKVYHNLGLVYDNMAKPQQALDNYYKSKNIKEQLNITNTLQHAYTLHNIALVYEKCQMFKEASSFYYQSYVIKEGLLGKESMDCTKTIHAMGFMFQRAGQLQNAIDCFNNALNAKVIHLGEDNIEIAYMYWNMAMVYKLMENFQQARNCFEKANKLYILNYGAEDDGSKQTKQFMLEMKEQLKLKKADEGQNKQPAKVNNTQEQVKNKVEDESNVLDVQNAQINDIEKNQKEIVSQQKLQENPQANKVQQKVNDVSSNSKVQEQSNINNNSDTAQPQMKKGK